MWKANRGRNIIQAETFETHFLLSFEWIFYEKLMLKWRYAKLLIHHINDDDKGKNPLVFSSNYNSIFPLIILLWGRRDGPPDESL